MTGMAFSMLACPFEKAFSGGVLSFTLRIDRNEVEAGRCRGGGRDTPSNQRQPADDMSADIECGGSCCQKKIDADKESDHRDTISDSGEKIGH